MQTITRETLQTLIEKVNAALRVIGDAEGVVMQVGNGSFGEANAKLTVTVAVKDGGVTRTPEHEELLQRAAMYGLPGVQPGQLVTIRGEAFTIVGLRRKARTTPVVLRRSRDGRGFRASLEDVKAALATRTAGSR